MTGEVKCAFSRSKKPSPLTQTLAALPVTLYVESPAFFNSFGSDLFRSGMCRYITCISEIGVPLSDAQRATWLSILDTSLERKEEPVQEEAALAFKAFTKSYPLDADQIRKYLACLHPSSEPFSRRGFNLAVGYIPHTSVGGTPLFDDVIAALCVSATIQEEKTWNDAEARRNAAHALTQQLLAAGELFATNVSEPTFRQAFYTMLNGMRDYSTDARGDVGSWMREACMVSMRLVCQMVLQLDNGVAVKYLQEDLMTNMIARLLQQSVEKIDKVRACAGDVLRWAIAEETKLPHVHGRKELIMALPRYVCGSGSGSKADDEFLDICHHDNLYSTAEINWNNPAEVYGRLMPILHIAQYRMDLLTGILVSVGGITESLVRHSSAAFVDFVGGLPATTDADRMSLLVLVSTINQIFERYTKEERVVIPLLEMLDILFGAGLLQPLAEEKAGSEVLMKTTLLVRREVMKCRDIRKVLAGIKV